MKQRLLAPLLGAALMASSSAATLIEDFSGDLSAWTTTRILNNGAHVPTNDYQWEITAGALRLNTSDYIGIEQFALTRTDITLGIGQEMRASYIHSDLGSQDIGLYVGAGTPTVDVRQDYVNIYIRDNGQLYSRGFNGNTEFSLEGGSTPTIGSDFGLFIARTGADTFELGYYADLNDEGSRTILSTRTVGNTDIGNAIGFYADIRGAGVRGSMDNLTIVPEPATALLGAFGAFALIRRRRA